MPVIHEPKFRKNVQEGLHYRDPYFAGLVMMMCALSSRDSDDPRVFLPGQDVHSAGWKYFDQVQIMRDTMFDLPGLYELQMYCVSASRYPTWKAMLMNLVSIVGSALCVGFSCQLDYRDSRHTILLRDRRASKATSRIPDYPRGRRTKACALVFPRLTLSLRRILNYS